MCKFFSLLGLSFLMFSCSNDLEDTTPSSPSSTFFNINVGNKWVYKRYHYNSITSNFSSYNRIDSVFVTGDTLINTLIYKKIIHKTYSDIVANPSFYLVTKDYLRVDNEDHLVTANGFVRHPGFDNQYQYTHDYYLYTDNTPFLMGSAIFQVQAPQNLLVEGQNFYLYDYKGDFTGNQSLNFPNNTIHYMYEEGTGLVLQRIPAVSGSGYFEDRLIYFEIN